MKPKIVITLLWLAGTFVLLSRLLYAANEYESRMMGAVAGQPGSRPTLDHAKVLEAKLRDAKTIDEASAIYKEIGMEEMRYGNAMGASAVFEEIIHRAWAFWVVSAVLPLLLLWWPACAASWRRMQTHTDLKQQNPATPIGSNETRSS